MKAFKAYDIRGVYNKDFNKDDAYKVGFYLPELLNTEKVLVGYDARESSPEIRQYLVQGILDSGADVYDAGMSTTPLIYFGTANFDFEASVMITASHNPAHYNGMKISRAKAMPVGYDSGLAELEKMIEQPIKKAVKPGLLKEIDVKTPYLAFLKKYAIDWSNLNTVIDCSNGVAGLFARTVFGDSPEYIYEEIDGTFPNHEPNPLIEDNVADLKSKVLEKNADAGIIFDGDGDRVMFVDEKGRFISPDLIIALMGHYFLEEKQQKGRVLQDIRTSKAVKNYIEKMGGEMHMWRVGRAYAATKLREIDGIFGGELAGHYYFRDFFYSDSGILAAIIVMRILKKQKEQGKSFSELIENIRGFENSGEINFRIEEKQQAMDEVKAFYFEQEKPEAFYDFDGYRVEYPDWWFNIRPSNTEPYLRLLVEANSDDLLSTKVAEIKSILEKYQ
ncbi:MAG: phosphomannomutase/phosphoglucomutase [Salinivirgaceae bacterium]|jgi:phosphomannomutase|nr:phosphomannomutase/phosphoglucomutase [Salinivirgaceae bacterium]